MIHIIVKLGDTGIFLLRNESALLLLNSLK